MPKVWLRFSNSEAPVEIDVQMRRERGAEYCVFRRGDSQTEVEVQGPQPDSGWLRLHGRIVPFHTLRQNDTIEAWIGGRKVRAEIGPRTTRRLNAGRMGAAETTAITAPMPGTILRVDVGLGDVFKAHQSLIVMESMKMEMTLSAPRDGRVKEIHCKLGQLVELGAVLIRIDPAGDDHDAS